MADLDAQDVSMVPNGGGHADLGLDVMMLGRRAPGLRIAPAPLPPALPSGEEGAADLNARFDERNSYSEAGTYPYHPDQVCLLPSLFIISIGKERKKVTDFKFSRRR